MKHLHTFEGFLNESDIDINEAAKEKYYDIKWNRDNQKMIYDAKTKAIDNAEAGMKVLEKVLEETNPDAFDLSSMGFAFLGNAAFVLVNVKSNNIAARLAVNYDMIESDPEFIKYFDLATTNLYSSSLKMYSSYFRVKGFA
jgi:hypothetical protein